MKFTKRVGEYDIGRTLGEGTFGKVKLGMNTRTKKHFAIKILEKQKIQKHKMVDQIRKEIAIMKKIQHDNIVGLEEVLVSKTKIFIVMELVLGGELFDKIVQEERLSEPKARYFFRQLISAVAYCHSQGIYHRDLKPENLLLTDQDVLKVSDFGLAALHDEDPNTPGGGSMLLHTTCGTPNYVAPEVLSRVGYAGAAADIWSCGVILFVLLAGYLPFDEPSMKTLFQQIKKAEFQMPSFLTISAQDLISKIIVADPTKRISLQQLVQHPWFNQGHEEPFELPRCATTDEPNTQDIFTEATEEDNKIDGMNAFDLIAAGRGLNLNGMFEQDVNEKEALRRPSSWTSPLPPKQLYDSVKAILSDAKFQIVEDAPGQKFTLSKGGPKGLLLVDATVCKLLGANQGVLTFKRVKGDALMFCDFVKATRGLLAEVINT
eukprot:Rmarinus@m.1389